MGDDLAWGDDLFRDTGRERVNGKSVRPDRGLGWIGISDSTRDRPYVYHSRQSSK